MFLHNNRPPRTARRHRREANGQTKPHHTPGALQLGAATAALPLVHIRTAGAAGKVSIGFWDHWVPGGNAFMQKQVDTWAERNKVEVRLTSSPATATSCHHRGGGNAGQDRPRRADILQLGRA